MEAPDTAETRLFPEMTLNFRTFRDDLARFDSRLANANMSVVGDLLVDFCDDRTQGLVVAYILGARITDVGDIYGLDHNEVKVMLEHAAASIALGIHEMTSIQLQRYEQVKADA